MLHLHLWCVLLRADSCALAPHAPHTGGAAPLAHTPSTEAAQKQRHLTSFMHNVPAPTENPFLLRPAVGAPSWPKVKLHTSARVSALVQRFQEVGPLGSGAFSDVIKAVSRVDGVAYAIKRTKEPFPSRAALQHALREVQALAALSGASPHLLPYHSAWTESNLLYIQNELAWGSLTRAVQGLRPLRPLSAAEVEEAWQRRARTPLPTSPARSPCQLEVTSSTLNTSVSGALDRALVMDTSAESRCLRSPAGATTPRGPHASAAQSSPALPRSSQQPWQVGLSLLGPSGTQLSLGPAPHEGGAPPTPFLAPSPPTTRTFEDTFPLSLRVPSPAWLVQPHRSGGAAAGDSQASSELDTAGAPPAPPRRPPPSVSKRPRARGRASLGGTVPRGMLSFGTQEDTQSQSPADAPLQRRCRLDSAESAEAATARGLFGAGEASAVSRPSSAAAVAASTPVVGTVRGGFAGTPSASAHRPQPLSLFGMVVGGASGTTDRTPSAHHGEGLATPASSPEPAAPLSSSHSQDAAYSGVDGGFSALSQPPDHPDSTQPGGPLPSQDRDGIGFMSSQASCLSADAYLSQEPGGGAPPSTSPARLPTTQLDLLRILRDIAHALAALHARDLAHLDVKPDNILVTYGGAGSMTDARGQWLPSLASATGLPSLDAAAVLLAQAGTERALPPDLPHAAVTYKLGDLGTISERLVTEVEEGDSTYVALELLNLGANPDAPPVDVAPADIFALGLSLLEVGSGAALTADSDTWHAVRSGDPPLDLPQCSPAFKALLRGMLAKDPAARPTAQQLLEHPLLAQPAAQPPLSFEGSLRAMALCEASLAAAVAGDSPFRAAPEPSAKHPRAPAATGSLGAGLALAGVKAAEAISPGAPTQSHRLSMGTLPKSLPPSVAKSGRAPDVDTTWGTTPAKPAPGKRLPQPSPSAFSSASWESAHAQDVAHLRALVVEQAAQLQELRARVGQA